MKSMMAMISLLAVVIFSMLVIRIGAVALEMTGLSRETAKFQAQSAFSGTGFTTSESEYVVSHPVRRRIIRTLIFIGSVGIVSAMATLLLTFVGQTREEATMRLLWLAVGMVIIYLVSRSALVDRGLRWVIKRALEKFTSLRIYDYEQLLGISRGYSIGEFTVKKGSWLENRTLKDLRFDEEGVLVLGIYRKIGKEEKYFGAPDGETRVMKGDTIVCYGPDEVIKNIACRLKGRTGNRQHEQAVKEEKLRKEVQGRELKESERQLKEKGA